MLLSCPMTHFFFVQFFHPRSNLLRLSPSAYPCHVYNFMCERRVPGRKTERKKTLLGLHWINDLCFGDDNLEQESHLNSSKNVADRCWLLFFTFIIFDHKTFICLLVCSAFRLMNSLVNKSNDLLFVSDFYGLRLVFSMFGVRREDRKWLKVMV